MSKHASVGFVEELIKLSFDIERTPHGFSSHGDDTALALAANLPLSARRAILRDHLHTVAGAPEVSDEELGDSIHTGRKLTGSAAGAGLGAAGGGILGGVAGGALARRYLGHGGEDLGMNLGALAGMGLGGVGGAAGGYGLGHLLGKPGEKRVSRERKSHNDYRQRAQTLLSNPDALHDILDRYSSVDPYEDKTAGFAGMVSSAATKLPGALEGLGGAIARNTARAGSKLIGGQQAGGLYRNAINAVGGRSNLHTALGAGAVGTGLLAAGAAGHKLVS